MNWVQDVKTGISGSEYHQQYREKNGSGNEYQINSMDEFSNWHIAMKNYNQYCRSRNIVKYTIAWAESFEREVENERNKLYPQRTNEEHSLIISQMLDEEMIMKNLAEGEISVVDICPERCWYK